MQNEMDTTNVKDTIKCWVELYSDNLYSWALHKTSSKETAEDLVQETFMAAVQSFGKYEGKSNSKTWLFAILNNKINDHYRTSFRKPIQSDSAFLQTFFDSNDNWKSEETPKKWGYEEGNLFDDPDFQKALEYCMGKLPENWFSAVQLKYLEEKNGELICQELGISPTNFWQILHRAKLQLRKCLEINWFKN
jgi:RNA polymerase sigma-70 factor (TIGR02943 family)